MKKILKIVTINNDNEEDGVVERGLYQQFFTYRICYINTSIDNTECVYMLIAVRQRDFVYIRKTNEIN